MWVKWRTQNRQNHELQVNENWKASQIFLSSSWSRTSRISSRPSSPKPRSSERKATPPNRAVMRQRWLTLRDLSAPVWLLEVISGEFWKIWLRKRKDWPFSDLRRARTSAASTNRGRIQGPLTDFEEGEVLKGVEEMYYQDDFDPTPHELSKFPVHFDQAAVDVQRQRLLRQLKVIFDLDLWNFIETCCFFFRLWQNERLPRF